MVICKEGCAWLLYILQRLMTVFLKPIKLSMILPKGFKHLKAWRLEALLIQKVNNINHTKTKNKMPLNPYRIFFETRSKNLNKYSTAFRKGNAVYLKINLLQGQIYFAHTNEQVLSHKIRLRRRWFSFDKEKVGGMSGAVLGDSTHIYH